MILATRNQHKVREMAELLPGVGLEPLPAEVELPPETGDSFEANALIDDSGHEYVFEARCEGTLLREIRGEGGFGYDPAFVPDETGRGDERTMAELPPEEKNAISHRGKAVRMLARHLGLEAGAGP